MPYPCGIRHRLRTRDNRFSHDSGAGRGLRNPRTSQKLCPAQRRLLVQPSPQCRHHQVRRLELSVHQHLKLRQRSPKPTPNQRRRLQPGSQVCRSRRVGSRTTLGVRLPSQALLTRGRSLLRPDHKLGRRGHQLTPVHPDRFRSQRQFKHSERLRRRPTRPLLLPLHRLPRTRRITRLNPRSGWRGERARRGCGCRGLTRGR